jgi:hypothetical protein
MRHALAPLVALGVAFSAVLWAGLDARTRRTARAGEEHVVRETMRVLPGPDLALAGGARHLRFLSLEEPSAAFADLPASLDSDPAGGAVAPPIAVWTDEARARGDIEVRHVR